MPRLKTKYKQMHFEFNYTNDDKWIAYDHRSHGFMLGEVYKRPGDAFNGQYVFETTMGERTFDAQCCRDIQLFLAQLNKKI